MAELVNTHSCDLELSSSQYLSRADSAPLSITGNMTIECWVKFESLPADGVPAVLVSKYKNTNGTRSYQFFVQNVTGTYSLGLATSADGTNQVAVIVTITPSVNIWYHYAVVYTAAGGTADFYENGVAKGIQQSGLATSIFDNAIAFIVGARIDAADAAELFLDGLIDDVRLWATTRTSGQILANHTIEIDSATNLNGSWHLNNALTDSSGNALTLTNNGTATFSTVVPFLLLTENIGASTESLTWEDVINITDTAGAPTEDADFDYDWGVATKATTTWTDLSKS